MPLELMIPAATAVEAEAAVRAGADALMLLAAGCGNFKDSLSAEQLCELIKYCRLRDVKAYVSFGAAVTDGELTELKSTVEAVNKNGADAVIVSDLGLLRMVRRLAPELPVFSGPLMPVHDIAGAIAMKELGVSRVMLAKELSLERIKFINDRVDVETAVFCHGTTCVSYDGRCHMSSAISSRPTQRGECAYPCRGLFTYFGDRPAAHLSLKDTCLAKKTDQLKSAGICALYIENAGKGAEYTAMVTAMFKNILTTDNLPSRSDMLKLESVFSREGFTDGFFTGEKGAAMFGAHNEVGEREAKRMLADVRRTYIEDPEQPTVAVDMDFRAKTDEKMTLVCRDGRGNEVTVTSPEAPLSRKGATREEVRECLERTERTVYYLRKCNIDIDAGLRITPAALGAMRKTALDGLTIRRNAVPERAAGDWQPGIKRLPPRQSPRWTMSFLKIEQITPEILDFDPERIYLPIWRMLEEPRIIGYLKKRGVIACAALDRITTDGEWPDTLSALRKLKSAGLTDVLCADVGQAAIMSPLGFELHGDFGITVFNSQTMKALKAMGLRTCTLSFEMTLQQIKELSFGMDAEMIVYGRLPLMLTENCLIVKRNGVHACHTGNVNLIDKTGRSYPLLAEKGCRTTLYNAEKLWLADRTEDAARSGASALRLCFTTENSSECLGVMRAYAENSTRPPERPTRGMYYGTAV